MPKKNNIILMVLAVIIVTFVSMAVGGLFIDGTTLSNPILKLVPSALHTLVGWFILIGSLITGILTIVEVFK